MIRLVITRPGHRPFPSIPTMTGSPSTASRPLLAAFRRFSKAVQPEIRSPEDRLCPHTSLICERGLRLRELRSTRGKCRAFRR